MLDPEVMKMPGWRGGDGDAAYLDKTLRHRDIELKLDETVNWRVIAQLFLQAFVVAVLAYIVIAIISGFFFLIDGQAGFAVFSFLSLLVWVLFLVVLLGSRLVEPIAEWRVLLADRQDRADSVYSKIAGTLQRRAIPIRVQYARIPTGYGPGSVSNRLVLKDGMYDVYVSVFSYGTSLYLGWMMWRSRRGATLIGQFIKELAESLTGRTGPEHQMLRTERPRAMREAVHAACREGLIVAVESQEVPVEFGFPGGMPPVSGSDGMPRPPMPRAPMPPPPPPPPAPSAPGSTGSTGSTGSAGSTAQPTPAAAPPPSPESPSTSAAPPPPPPEAPAPPSPDAG